MTKTKIDDDAKDRLLVENALGRAVEVIAMTCEVQGQHDLAFKLLELWRARDFETLIATFQTMSHSFPSLRSRKLDG